MTFTAFLFRCLTLGEWMNNPASNEPIYGFISFVVEQIFDLENFVLNEEPSVLDGSTSPR